MNKHIPTRQCISCRSQIEKDKLICIKKYLDSEANSYKILIITDNKKFGRSAYVCKNNSCIQIATKGKKIHKILKVSLDLINEIIPELNKFLVKERECA